MKLNEAFSALSGSGQYGGSFSRSAGGELCLCTTRNGSSESQRRFWLHCSPSNQSQAGSPLPPLHGVTIFAACADNREKPALRRREGEATGAYLGLSESIRWAAVCTVVCELLVIALQLRDGPSSWLAPLWDASRRGHANDPGQSV